MIEFAVIGSDGRETIYYFNSKDYEAGNPGNHHGEQVDMAVNPFVRDHRVSAQLAEFKETIRLIPVKSVGSLHDLSGMDDGSSSRMFIWFSDDCDSNNKALVLRESHSDWKYDGMEDRLDTRDDRKPNLVKDHIQNLMQRLSLLLKSLVLDDKDTFDLVKIRRTLDPVLGVLFTGTTTFNDIKFHGLGGMRGKNGTVILQKNPDSLPKSEAKGWSNLIQVMADRLAGYCIIWLTDAKGRIVVGNDTW
jgi:hypothetical protein